MPITRLIYESSFAGMTRAQLLGEPALVFISKHYALCHSRERGNPSVLAGKRCEMADAFSRSVIIQTLLSIPLIILGMVVMYLIHRANSEPPQIALHDPSDESEIVEGLPDEEKPYKAEEPDRPKPARIKPEVQNPAKYDADLTKRLGKLKYNGYMQVGKAKLAWLSDGKSRTAVKAGETLDGNIRIDNIHENFLLVSVADGRTTRKIPFTSGSNEYKSMQSAASIQEAAVNRSSGLSKTYLSRENTQDSFNDETVIHIAPELKTVKSPDETFTVKVKIDNGLNVFAVPFDINYDPDVLEITGMYEGPYLKKDGGQTTFLTSTDKEKGEISIGLTRLGRIGGVSGSGILASIVFRALKGGTTFLSFANGRPMDSRLNALPARFVRGKVEVR